jgi:transcriptional regulator with XRE-family HTH domain
MATTNHNGLLSVKQTETIGRRKITNMGLDAPNHAGLHRRMAKRAADPPPVPNRIKELRKRRGLTQPQLAEAAGTTFQQIYKLENSKRKLPQQWMDRIAPALGVRPAALIDADVEGLPDPQAQAQLVDDPDELALLWLWRNLSPKMRGAALTLLQANVESLGTKVA